MQSLITNTNGSDYGPVENSVHINYSLENIVLEEQTILWLMSKAIKNLR